MIHHLLFFFCLPRFASLFLCGCVSKHKRDRLYVPNGHKEEERNWYAFDGTLHKAVNSAAKGRDDNKLLVETPGYFVFGWAGSGVGSRN